MEEIREINGIELCSEALGDPADPTVLLIAGAASSMPFWHDDFVHALGRADGT